MSLSKHETEEAFPAVSHIICSSNCPSRERFFIYLAERSRKSIARAEEINARLFAREIKPNGGTSGQGKI